MQHRQNGSAAPWAVTAVLAVLLVAAAPALAADTLERTFDLAPGGALVVDASGAAIRVTGQDAPGATVRIRAKGDDLDDWQIDMGVTGDTLRVTAKRRRSLRSLWGGSRGLSIEIAVPRRTRVSLDTSGGALEVAGIEGAVDLDTSGGSISVRDVVGDVAADTSGGSIRAEQVRGKVSLDTSGGSIRAVDIEGPLDADTSGGSISVRRVAGDARLDTSGGSISVEDAGGRVEAETSGGSIEVSFAEGNAAGGSLSTSAGGVTILVDPSVALDLDLAASAGKVRVDLPVEETGSHSAHRLTGRLNGGGATLRARSSAGSIRLAARP